MKSLNQQIGRELLTPDEVRMMDNIYALLFIRGERPIQDFKFDILKHPNVTLSADGKADVYRHGEITQSVATISLEKIVLGDVPDMQAIENDYELLPDEDIEEYFENIKEEKQDENQKNKVANKLPMGRKVRKGFAIYVIMVLMLIFGSVTAFAANDPVTVVNNLSDPCRRCNHHLCKRDFNPYYRLNQIHLTSDVPSYIIVNDGTSERVVCDEISNLNKC